MDFHETVLKSMNLFHACSARPAIS